MFLQRGVCILSGPSAVDIDFKRVVDLAPVPMVWVDARGVLTYANAAAAELMGCTVEELVGSDSLTLYAPEDRQGAAELWERARAGETLRNIEKTILRRDGRTLRVLYDMVPRFDPDGRFQGVWGYARVGSPEDSRLAARARDAEERYRDLVNGLPCVVYEVEPAWPPKLVFISDRIEHYTGYRPEDMYRDARLVVETIHPEDRERLAEAASRVTFRPEPYWLEYRVVHRHSGEVFHMRAISLPRVVDGRVVRRHGVMVDVTEEKRLERELLRSQRLAAIGEIATMMAHEIRNPLAGISLAVRALRRGASGKVRDECLDDIEACLRRVNDTVERTLNFARARPFQPRPCSLKSVIEAVKNLAATYVRKSDIAWEEDIAPGIPDLVADPDQLAQALVNLVLNACKAMPSGGRLSLRAWPDGKGVVVEVGDTGIGIPPQELGRIFDPFYSGFGEGAGLGLPLARRIVKAHGGSISVRSTVGEGTVFRIELPLEPDHAKRPGH